MKLVLKIFYSEIPESVYNNFGVAVKQEMYATDSAVGYFEHSLSKRYKANIDNLQSWKYVEVNGQYLH